MFFEVGIKKWMSCIPSTTDPTPYIYLHMQRGGWHSSITLDQSSLPKLFNAIKYIGLLQQSLVEIL
jgi:hypothetical protein